jgi:hypothetical protein
MNDNKKEIENISIFSKKLEQIIAKRIAHRHSENLP